MTEKLNIVQSTTEPDKRNIWLKDNELKKFGAKGWSTIGGKGGGASLDGPEVSELSGEELVPISDNGKNKVITVNNLLNSGKEICNIILDYGTGALTNYSEVLDTLININNSTKCFVMSNDNTKDYSVTVILDIVYNSVKKTISVMMLCDDVRGPALTKYEFSSEDGHITKISTSPLTEWKG